MAGAPYSYRNDPAVPSFPDDRPLVLFDGECALCSRWARLILRDPGTADFRLVPSQSPLGAALLTHCGLDPHDPSTMLLVEDGRMHDRTEAILGIAARLSWPWRAALVLHLAPPALRDAAYGWIARRRRSLFRGETWCAAPGDRAALADRVLG